MWELRDACFWQRSSDLSPTLRKAGLRWSWVLASHTEQATELATLTF